ncbi:MAG: YIP1 family protein [Gemmatimonadota bacterium]|nr:YIP1 family protein [Gemmatimonadota bacterium]
MDEFESGGAPEEAEKDLEAEQTEVAVEASEAEDAVGSELPSLPNRVLNVFLSPGKLMDAIAQTPAVTGALGTAAFLIAVSTLLIPAEMMAETMRQAALDAGGQAPPEAFMNAMRYITPVMAMISIVVVTFISAGLYWLVFSFVLGDDGRYRQYLAVGAHALLVPAIIGLALVPLKVMTEDPAATLNLGLFAPFLEDGYLGNVLRILDITGIWSALIVAQGAHSIDPKRSFGSAAVVTLGITLVFALIFASFVP